MGEFKINDDLLLQEAQAIARAAIAEEASKGIDAIEYIWDAVDDHDWVRYDFKAIKLCEKCDTTAGEISLAVCEYNYDCYEDYASKLAWATLQDATRSEYGKITGEI